jgi:hypothetical protein
MKRLSLLVAICLIALIPAQSMALDLAVGAKATSLGMTFEGMTSVHPKLNLRAGFSTYSYDYDGEEPADNPEFSYDGDLSLGSFTVLADYFPFQSAMYLTGGIVFNSTTTDIAITPMDSYIIGTTTYGPDELGTLGAEVDYGGAQPYMAIGFGNPLMGSNLGFSFELGAIYTGTPDVNMTATGLLEPSAEQGGQIEENLDWLKWYPVMSLGLTYHF